MTKISNTIAYSFKEPVSLNDYVIGSDSELSNKKTKNFKMQDVRDLIIAGLSPIEGGVFKTTEIEIDTLVTDVATTVNAMSPSYDVVAYEQVWFNIAGLIYVLKSVDLTIGVGGTTLTNGDFIIVPSNTGASGLNADMTRSSTTSLAVGNSGSKTLTYASSSNLGWAVGTRLRYSNSVSNYIEGVVTAVSSTSVTITADNSAGSGTLAVWTISVAGDKGSAGANGTNGTNGTNGLNADVTRTSVTSNVIASSGSKTFAYTASTNLGWLVGTRLRFFNSVGNYMEGVVSAVSTTSVTATIDNSSGSGTYTSWNISITGDVGQDATSNNLQKTIAYPADFTSGNYNLVEGDNNYTIIVDNGATNVTITVPTGLSNAFVVGLTQNGSGNVTFVESSTTINTPVGLLIKGQYYTVAIEQKSNSNIFFLMGNTKV